jgi:hypothetical protein
VGFNQQSAGYFSLGGGVFVIFNLYGSFLRKYSHSVIYINPVFSILQHFVCSSSVYNLISISAIVVNVVISAEIVPFLPQFKVLLINR